VSAARLGVPEKPEAFLRDFEVNLLALQSETPA